MLSQKMFGVQAVAAGSGRRGRLLKIAAMFKLVPKLLPFFRWQVQETVSNYPTAPLSLLQPGHLLISRSLRDHPGKTKDLQRASLLRAKEALAYHVAI